MLKINKDRNDNVASNRNIETFISKRILIELYAIEYDKQKCKQMKCYILLSLSMHTVLERVEK